MIGTNEGEGKTTFLKHLFCERKHYQTGLSLDLTLKEIFESASDRLANEFNELPDISHVNIEKFKTLFDHDVLLGIRPAYARKTINKAVNFVYFGTSNQVTIVPNDGKRMRG